MIKIWDKLEEINYTIDDFLHDFYCAVFKFPGRTFLRFWGLFSQNAWDLYHLYVMVDSGRYWLDFHKRPFTEATVLESAYAFDRICEVANFNHKVTLYNYYKYWFLKAKDYYND